MNVTRPSRRLTKAVLAVALVVPVAGCSVGDSIAGLKPVPTEKTGGAPLSQVTAGAIVTRVLTQVNTAGTAAGTAATAARSKVLAGSALTATNAAVSAKEKTAKAAPPTPKVLAMSQGRGWPRWILATTLDAKTKQQRLYYLTSSAPTQPFVLSANVAMLGGAQVPSLGEVTAGVPSFAAGKPLKATPAQILKAYAGALTYPKPVATTIVGTKDSYSTTLKAAAAAQAKALGSLATFQQAQAATSGAAGAPIAIRLANGGALVFGQLARTDRVTLSSTAQRLNLPPLVKSLSGKSTASKSAVVRTIESFAFVVPANGPATVVAAEEQVASATAS